MPKVSVIIPVYNSQEYLQRCVKSIQSQTLLDLEIIMVDDGSTDNTSLICADLMKDDTRLKYYHQENSGVAVARQKGLELSTGNYVIHVDSDDWIEPQMLREMYDEANRKDADVVICDVVTDFSENTRRYYKQTIEKKDSDSIFSAMLFGDLMCSVFNKLIKREIISKFNICFYPGLNTGEDMLFCCSLYRHDIKTAFVNKAFYHYDLYSNNNSITRFFSQEKVEQRVQVSKRLFDGLDDNKYIEERDHLLWKTVEMAFFSECDRGFFYLLFSNSQKKKLVEKAKSGINNIFTKRCIIYALNGHLLTARRINKLIMCLLNPIRSIIKKL